MSQCRGLSIERTLTAIQPASHVTWYCTAPGNGQVDEKGNSKHAERSGYQIWTLLTTI